MKLEPAPAAGYAISLRAFVPAKGSRLPPATAPARQSRVCRCPVIAVYLRLSTRARAATTDLRFGGRTTIYHDRCAEAALMGQSINGRNNFAR